MEIHGKYFSGDRDLGPGHSKVWRSGLRAGPAKATE